MAEEMAGPGKSDQVACLVAVINQLLILDDQLRSAGLYGSCDVLAEARAGLRRQLHIEVGEDMGAIPLPPLMGLWPAERMRNSDQRQAHHHAPSPPAPAGAENFRIRALPREARWSATAQLDLFAAKQARDRALEQVLSTPHVLYKERLWKAISDFALDPEPFTSDDLREAVGDPPVSCSPNIAGAVVMAALKRGAIRQIGWTRSKRVIGHANKIGLYIGAEFAS